MSNEEIYRKLYSSGNPESYGTKSAYHAHLLEQYKLYQTSADNISNRRQAANAFFVTVNTAIVSLVSYLSVGGSDSSHFYWVSSIAGISISYMWYRLIRSYKDLNTAKYKVIHEIERNLPIRPYDAEWEAVDRGEDKKVYLPFTHIEIFIPWVFVLLHAYVFIMSLIV